MINLSWAILFYKKKNGGVIFYVIFCVYYIKYLYLQ